MERIQSLNPDRLAWCCADRGVTLEACAAEVGIATANLQKVMAGEPGLTFNQLRKLAEFFGRGVLFFLEPGAVDEALVHTPQFRTLANQKPELSPRIKALIERVEKQRAIFLSLREELDDADLPRFASPDLAGLEIPAAAHAVRQWLGLADTNDFESYRQAVEAKGLTVSEAEFTRIPKNTTVVPDEDAPRVMKLLDILDDHDDVQNLYSNVEFSEAAQAAME